MSHSLSTMQGIDRFAELLMNGHIRVTSHEGELYGSLVDVIARFLPHIKRPSQYWSDNRDKIFSTGEFAAQRSPIDELYAACVRLSLPATDGKQRQTDAAPLWVCAYVAMTVNADFRLQVAKLGMSPAAIKYRLQNIANGMEWAADTIHQRLEDENLLGEES